MIKVTLYELDKIIIDTFIVSSKDEAINVLSSFYGGNWIDAEETIRSGNLTARLTEIDVYRYWKAM